jgi:hypothetical protein
MDFQPGVLGGHDSVKGFRVVASDGPAGCVSWASYAPGESYLVVTLGRIGRKHHVIPARAVTEVEDGEVRVALGREQIRQLPDVPKPHLASDPQTGAQVMASAMAAWSRTAGSTGA